MVCNSLFIYSFIFKLGDVAKQPTQTHGRKTYWASDKMYLLFIVSFTITFAGPFT